MLVLLQAAVDECVAPSPANPDHYLIGDVDTGTLLLTKKQRGDFSGGAMRDALEDALNVSEPMPRAMDHTTSAIGTKDWRERRMEMSSHFHSDVDLNPPAVAT